MCGICGYITKKAISSEELTAMNDTLYHRGPDDGGIWIAAIEDYSVGLAHRRLAIMDLSKLGHQPMFSEDGETVIVFNGEIYNFLELQKELMRRGYKFKSKSDTEVLLNAYCEWQESMLHKLEGMFAIAICDKRRRKLLLARDRMGEKPLYYHWDGKELIFASTLSPIMKYPHLKKTIKKEVMAGFLCNKFIMSPDTIFENVWKLEAGEYLVWEKGNIFTKYYWNVWEKYQECSKIMITDFWEAKEELDKLINESVQRRMIADVPVGIFLSGGIDSSLVAAIAQKQSKTPVKTFTIGFYEKEKDEAPRAKKIAEYLGTDHTEMYISYENIIDLVNDIPIYFDEPFADSSQIPTMLVSKMAREKVTVALAGEGGDELFCGYKRYDWVKISQYLDWIGNIGDQILNLPGITALNIKSRLPVRERVFLSNRDNRYKTQYFSMAREEITKKLVLFNSKRAQHSCEEKINVKDWQIRRMLVDQQQYLPNEILQKSDKASMKYSLELRCPLLDYHIVEYLYRIPQKYKYHFGTKKYILKQLVYDKIPQQLLDMPKRGFSVPLAKWLREPLNTKVHMYADAAILKKQELFNAEEIEKLITIVETCNDNIYPTILWNFYVFQMWYQMYIEDLWNEA